MALNELPDDELLLSLLLELFFGLVEVSLNAVESSLSESLSSESSVPNVSEPVNFGFVVVPDGACGDTAAYGLLLLSAGLLTDMEVFALLFWHCCPLCRCSLVFRHYPW